MAKGCQKNYANMTADSKKISAGSTLQPHPKGILQHAAGAQHLRAAPCSDTSASGSQHPSAHSAHSSGTLQQYHRSSSQAFILTLRQLQFTQLHFHPNSLPTGHCTQSPQSAQSSPLFFIPLEDVVQSHVREPSSMFSSQSGAQKLSRFIHEPFNLRAHHSLVWLHCEK